MLNIKDNIIGNVPSGLININDTSKIIEIDIILKIFRYLKFSLILLINLVMMKEKRRK
jgi:hypothetical protein